MTSRTGYSGVQIGLHWIIAAMVGFQLFFGESMTAVVDAADENAQASTFDQTMAGAHLWVGVAILALVLVRLVVRLIKGAPEPASDNGLLALAAKVTHWLFYAFLVAMPATGLVARYVDDSFGDVHSLGKPILIVMIGVHALAALYHQFIVKDGTLRRMLVPAR